MTSNYRQTLCFTAILHYKKTVKIETRYNFLLQVKMPQNIETCKYKNYKNNVTKTYTCGLLLFEEHGIIAHIA